MYGYVHTDTLPLMRTGLGANSTQYLSTSPLFSPSLWTLFICPSYPNGTDITYKTLEPGGKATTETSVSGPSPQHNCRFPIWADILLGELFLTWLLQFGVQGPVYSHPSPCSPATTMITSTNEMPQSRRDSAMQPLPGMGGGVSGEGEGPKGPSKQLSPTGNSDGLTRCRRCPSSSSAAAHLGMSSPLLFSPYQALLASWLCSLACLTRE